jgi:hypothetical protein
MVFFFVQKYSVLLDDINSDRDGQFGRRNADVYRGLRKTRHGKVALLRK